MKPAEFLDWLDRHNLNPVQAAQFLEIERRTIDRYLDGNLEIPRRVELACLALEPLRLYRLKPVDLDHIDWRASSHKGPATVRAQSAELARWHAAAKFHVRTRPRKGEDVSAENPWLQAERVTVKEIADKKGGQPGVVD